METRTPRKPNMQPNRQPIMQKKTLISATLATVIAVAALGGTGCGGPGGGTQTSGLLQDVSIVLAQYLVLDLGSGKIDARSDVPDLATNAEYRRTKMVFKAISAGSSTSGQAGGSFCAQADESPSANSVSKYYIAVYETTQAQWQLVTGTTPWVNVVPASVVGGVINDPDSPAFNITYNAATQALAVASGALHTKLDLPTDGQWEHACRAGGAGHFSWGSNHTDTVAANFALVAETSGNHVGPDPVGTFAPNAFGLYDMHGNVWEMTKGNTIRGGSWSDTLAQARTANKSSIDPRTAHALVGMRLVLIP